MTIDPQTQERIDYWRSEAFDSKTRQEVQALLDNDDHTALVEAFYKELEFGTGGLRGIMGTGTNRVNRYTIGMATQGLANFLNKNYAGKRISVVVAHDCRNHSDTLAKVTADVFSANGIEVYFFQGLRPTPELSYAIRHFGSQSGVMLTASHNPKEYNGYKAYGDDGGQLVSPADKAVLTEVRQVTAEDVKFDGDDSLIHLIGAEVDEMYLEELTRLSLSPEAIRAQHDISIVFSPIHGTGGVLVPDYLKKLGFTNIHLVQEQMVVDGNFPTVIYPNPEEAEALAMAIKLAKDVDADLVMATDPDADRVGIAIKNDRDQHILLNGNQTAVLLFGYVLDRWSNGGRLAGSEYIVKTIVTTYLLDRIAESYGVDCYNTLTGFKHIGALMSANQGAKSFIVGGEESYGYLVGEHARDKDAVVSCGMLAEMAAYYRNEGKSPYDALLDTYVEHGLYQEKLVALTKKGKSGSEEIEQMISTFRNDPPKTLGDVDVVRIKDYQLQIDHDLLTDEKSSIDLPVSNVLQFFTADGSIVSARPSGTEPKIKFYCSVHTTLDSKQEYAEKQVLLHKRIEAICADLGV